MHTSIFNPFRAGKRDIPWWVWPLVIVASPAILMYRWLKKSPEEEIESQRIEIERLPPRPSPAPAGPPPAEVPEESRRARPAAKAPVVPPGTVKAAARPEAEPAAVEPAAQAENEPQAAAPDKPDNLRRIEGIGPKVAGLLNAAGIRSFQDLAGRSPEELRSLLNEAGLYMIDPGTWPEQAQLAAAGQFAELADLQAHLKGGRQTD